MDVVQLVIEVGSTPIEAQAAELAAMLTEGGMLAARCWVMDTSCKCEKDRKRPAAQAMESHPGARAVDSAQPTAERPRETAEPMLRPEAATVRPGSGTGTSSFGLLAPGFMAMSWGEMKRKAINLWTCRGLFLQ